MKQQPLKTAASCEAHGERTYTCHCGTKVTRKACETWHQDQCDDCIVRWAYDKAIKDADKAISNHSPDHILKWHADIVLAWRIEAEKRGLVLDRRKP